MRCSPMAPRAFMQVQWHPDGQNLYSFKVEQRGLTIQDPAMTPSPHPKSGDEVNDPRSRAEPWLSPKPIHPSISITTVTVYKMVFQPVCAVKIIWKLSGEPGKIEWSLVWYYLMLVYLMLVLKNDSKCFVSFFLTRLFVFLKKKYVFGYLKHSL